MIEYGAVSKLHRARVILYSTSNNTTHPIHIIIIHPRENRTETSENGVNGKKETGTHQTVSTLERFDVGEYVLVGGMAVDEIPRARG